MSGTKGRVGDFVGGDTLELVLIGGVVVVGQAVESWGLQPIGDAALMDVIVEEAMRSRREWPESIG